MTKDLIGFWGYPHPEAIEKAKIDYPNAEFIDLDIDWGHKDANFAPDAYCVIIRNICNNALALKDRLIKILAAVGKDKCDSGFFAANLLIQEGIDVEMTVFEDASPVEKINNLYICKSSIPLKTKIEMITGNIVKNEDFSHIEQTQPRFGFWGVPPNDLSVLELFPDNTHIYGWVRCVEAREPANIDLEMYVDKDIPTVFFSQTFCAKTLLARHLAKKYNGLYIDIDGTATNSSIAKIQAFLKLR